MSFRPNGQDASALTEGNRDLCRQTRKAKDSTLSEFAGARGVGAQLFGTSFDTAMRLCMSEISGASQLRQRRL